MKINERILNKKDIDDEVIKVNKNKVNYIYTANNVIPNDVCKKIIKYIEEFNQQNHSYQLEVNQFADMNDFNFMVFLIIILTINLYYSNRI